MSTRSLGDASRSLVLLLTIMTASCGDATPENVGDPDAGEPFAPAAAEAGDDDANPRVSDDGATIDDTMTLDGAGTTDSTAPPDTMSVSDASAPPAKETGSTATKSPLGKYVLTWYSFQDNTPVNSALSASGRKLIPYVSVAIPSRYLKPFGGKVSYGDQFYVAFLAGRTMPNGTKHTGWVQIDDFCGDGGDDSYCFQSVGGKSYPNVDLYIGDYTSSGMSTTTCSGPAGSGQELTDVSTGSAGSDWIADYGGKALGPGKCGDLTSAKSAHGKCWDYTPPASSASECKACTTSSCTSW